MFYLSPTSPAVRFWDVNADVRRVARLLEVGESLCEHSLERAVILNSHLDIERPDKDPIHQSLVGVLAVQSMPSTLQLRDLVAERYPFLFTIPDLDLLFATTVYSPLPHGHGIGPWVYRSAGWKPLALDETPFALPGAASLQGQAAAWDIRIIAEHGMPTSLRLCDAPIITFSIRNVSDSETIPPSC
jgi:hypothetical protein